MDDTTSRAVNVAAIATGYGQDGDTELLPCIEIGGIAVFAYYDDGTLRVALHFDGADPEVWPTLNSAEACIPVVIDAGGPVPVWTADEHGTETTPDTPEVERLRSQIDELTNQLRTTQEQLERAEKNHAEGGQAQEQEPRSGEPHCNHDSPALTEEIATLCECGTLWLLDDERRREYRIALAAARATLI